MIYLISTATFSLPTITCPGFKYFKYSPYSSCFLIHPLPPDNESQVLSKISITFDIL